MAGTARQVAQADVKINNILQGFHETDRAVALDTAALNPNFRTTLLSGICIPKLVLKEDANERKKKGTFGQI